MCWTSLHRSAESSVRWNSFRKTVASAYASGLICCADETIATGSAANADPSHGGVCAYAEALPNRIVPNKLTARPDTNAAVSNATDFINVANFMVNILSISLQN